MTKHRPAERQRAVANADGIAAAYESATLCLNAATVLAIVCETAVNLPRKAQAGVLVDAAPLYAELIVALRAAERDLWPVLNQIRVACGDARQPLFRFGEIEGTTAIHTVVLGARYLVSRTGFTAFAPHFKQDHPYHRADVPFAADFKAEVRRALEGPWESSVLPAWRRLKGISKQLNTLKVQLGQEAEEAHAHFVEPLGDWPLAGESSGAKTEEPKKPSLILVRPINIADVAAQVNLRTDKLKERLERAGARIVRKNVEFVDLWLVLPERKAALTKWANEHYPVSKD